MIATVSMFLVLVKLGFWQLDRAELKTQLQSQLIERQASEPLTFDQILGTPTSESLTGYRLNASVGPVSENIFLLDNQVFNGRVGYLAIQAMQVSQEQPWILVELGFIPAGTDRRILPDIKAIDTTLTLNGKLYQKYANPMSSTLMPESGWPKRIQNLNIPEISKLLDKPIAPVIFQPDDIPGLNLPHPWTPIPLSAQKHRGYALQWFSMAIAFALLVLFFIKSTVTKNTEKQRDNDIGNQD